MGDAEIRDELLTLLVAGHETTATALSWALERLVRHPQKLERLRAEVLAGEDAYLTATIQETLRRRPVLPNAAPRLVMKPVTVGQQAKCVPEPPPAPGAPGGITPPAASHPGPRCAARSQPTGGRRTGHGSCRAPAGRARGAVG